MRITRKQLSLLIENYLLVEAVHDKVAMQMGITDPDKIEQLRIASERPHKLQKPELLWIAKYFTTPEGSNTEEPIEDIVSAIKALGQNKAALSRRGSKTNLSDYKSPGEITIAVSLSRGFVAESELGEQAEVLYEDDNWKVSMPHTREASCTIGRGTAWCTAIPGAGNNLFYNYVINGRAILYYVVKKNAREDELARTTHFSLGTMDGKIHFPQENRGSGGIVVDGGNNGLTRARFLSQVGNQLGQKIIAIIENHSQKNRNKHPAKKKLLEMARNPALYDVEMRGKSIDVRYDFTAMMLDYLNNILYRLNQLRADGTTERDNLGGQLTENDIEAIVAGLTDSSSQLNKSISRATEIQQKDVDRLNKALANTNTEVVGKFGKVYADGEKIQQIEHAVRRRNQLTGQDYRFCINLDKLRSAIPVYFYKKIENIGKSYIDAWDSNGTGEFDNGVFAYAKETEVYNDLEYLIETDEAYIGMPTGDLGNAFKTMLNVYLHNILFSAGYCMIHDPEIGSNSPYPDAGTQVVSIYDYDDARMELYWVSNDSEIYDTSYAEYTPREISAYMQNNFTDSFIQWCDSYGFTFSVM